MEKHAESVHTNTDKKNERISGLRKLAAVGALSAIALTGCAANNVEAQPSPVETTTSASPVPLETTEPTPAETPQPGATYETYTVEELQIPAGLSDEEFGRLVVEERLALWVNAGANEGLLTRKEEEGLSWEELLPKIADENRDLFVEALINPNGGWRTGGGATTSVIWGGYTQESIERLREWNLSVLRSYVATQWSDNPEDKEGYRASFHVEDYGEVWNDAQHGYGSGDGRVNAIFAVQSNGDLNSRGGTIREDKVFHAMFQETKVEGDQEWIQGFMLSAPTDRQ